MKRLLLSAMTVSVLAMSGLTTAAEPYVAGKDYTVLTTPGKVDKPWAWLKCVSSFGTAARTAIP